MHTRPLGVTVFASQTINLEPLLIIFPTKKNFLIALMQTKFIHKDFEHLCSSLQLRVLIIKFCIFTILFNHFINYFYFILKFLN